MSTAGTALKTPYRSLWMACFLGYAAIGMTIQVMPAFVHQRLGAGAVAAGTAVTVGSLATMLARPLAGKIADRRGGRGVVMAGAGLGVAGGLMHLFAASLWQLVLARLLLGAGEGALFTAAIGWVLAGVAQQQRGKVAGHFGLSLWCGIAAGPVLAALLMTVGSFRAVWLAASLAPAVAWLLLLRAPASAPVAAALATAPRAMVPAAVWRPAWSNVFGSIGYGMIAAFLVPHGQSLHLAGSNFGLALFGVVLLAVRWFGSPAVDRFGPARVLLVALLGQAVGLLLLYLAHDLGWVVLGIVLSGAGLSMLFPCVASLVTARAAPNERSSALGALISAWDLGFALGGPLGGSVAGATAAAPFAVGAAAALLAMVPLLWPAARPVLAAPIKPRPEC